MINWIDIDDRAPVNGDIVLVWESFWSEPWTGRFVDNVTGFVTLEGDPVAQVCHFTHWAEIQPPDTP